MLEGSAPLPKQTSTGADVLIQGVTVEPLQVPLHKVELKSDLVTGAVTVGARPFLPVTGAQLILGNDLAGGKVSVDPLVTATPESHHVSVDDNIYPACAVTRAMTKGKEQNIPVPSPNSYKLLGDKARRNGNPNEESIKPDDADLLDLSDTFMSHDADVNVLDNGDHMPSSVEVKKARKVYAARNDLIALQEKDPSLSKIQNRVVSEPEAKDAAMCNCKLNGVLMRKWRSLDARPSEGWRVVHQIVIPEQYRSEVLHLAHEALMAGHLGIDKTYRKALQNFYWPGLKRDVKLFCRSCHACQLVGKPNQNRHTAPLRPIPAFAEPFSQVIVDCVGPLPKTKAGHQYLLTIMYASIRFPVAIPLRNIQADTIVKHLIKFFTLVGLPKTAQSDQGLAELFQQVMYMSLELSRICQVHTTPNPRMLLSDFIRLSKI